RCRQQVARGHKLRARYWDIDGWVAPDETVSGLEVEYNWYGDMPKLIYIKESAGKRDERLTQLLQRIKNDDRVSYKIFQTADELGGLIMNDLAVLLTERFNLTIQNKLTEESRTFHSIPAIPDALVGREVQVHEIINHLNRKSVRLVTLTGPGGIGKTRLAIDVARKME